MPHFSLTYQLTGAGWAEAHVSDGVTTLRLDVSYIGDGIEAPAWAAIALLQTAEHSEFAWLDEPRWWGEGSGSSYWVLDKQGTQLQITVLSGWSFDDLREKGRNVLLSVETTPLKFAIQVWDALRHLQEEHGVEGYHQRWCRAFPLKSYQQLEDLIRMAKRAARATRSAQGKRSRHKQATI
jgi:hypothetical protein